MALLVALCLVACSNGSSRSGNGLSSEKVTSDVRFAEMLVETAHPSPFVHESRSAFETSIESIPGSLGNEPSPEALYRKLAPVIAGLGDSHTNLVTYTKAYQAFRNSNGRIFPLELRVVDRRAFVTANYGPERTIPVGAELAQVDGLTIPALLDRLGRFVGAEDTALRDAFLAGDIRAYMWHAGMQAPFQVTYYGPARRTIAQTLRGTTIGAIHAWDNSNAGYDALTPFRMDYADGGSVGVLTIHSFDSPDGWHDFTRHLIGEMKAHGTRALVIDLRENSGGNTDTSDALLSLLARQRFRDFSQVDVKVSNITKQSYGEKRYIEIYGSDAWDSPNDQLLQQSVDWTDPVAARWAFPGRVYVLEGAATFSTAAIFTAAVQDCRIGLILGQESGGIATLYGESFSFTLPSSGLEGTVSTKFFVRPNGDRALRGVTPNLRLPATAPGVPEDAELNAAIRYAFEHS